MRVRFLAPLLAGLLVLTTAACSDDKDDSMLAPPDETATTAAAKPKPRTEVTLEVVKAAVVSGTNHTRELPKAARRQVLDTLQRYVNRASLHPLVDGGKARDLLELFSDTAGPAVRRDRARLVDEAMPVVTSFLPTSRGDVELSALLSPADRFEVVSARLELVVDGRMEDGRVLKVRRRGQLALVRERGAWRIDSYDLKVVRQIEREAAGGPSTTTVEKGGKGEGGKKGGKTGDEGKEASS